MQMDYFDKWQICYQKAAKKCPFDTTCVNESRKWLRKEISFYLARKDLLLYSLIPIKSIFGVVTC